MTKVVIDTSVLVSALHSEHGANAAVLDLIIQGELIWCVSEEILAEYQAVLSRSKFNYIDLKAITAALVLASSGQMTLVAQTLSHSPDESDNRFYECAQAAKADYLVTGNRKHFPKSLPPTKIVSPASCWTSLEKNKTIPRRCGSHFGQVEFACIFRER